MDANWTMSNHRTSMVQKVLYSGCKETAAQCSPYCTCIRYSSDSPTARKSNHQIHLGEITRDTTTSNKNDKTTMLKLTRNERETGAEREAERKRKEDKEV